MPKEKNYNPVQAQRKADKAREVKKGKAEAKGRRDEKLARKNPERLQKQIDDLKSITEKGGKLSKHEEQVLEGLEREVKAVRKARETLGDKAPSFGRFDGGGGGGGGDSRPGFKRRRGDGEGSDSDSAGEGGQDVPEDVRRIPMPRDTPPPIPKAEMDRWWARRRAKRDAARQSYGGGRDAGAGADADTGTGRKRDERRENDDRGGKRARTGDVAAAHVESRTVYEAKPIVRDLRKEAVAAFVPTAVQMKMSKGRGQGGLLEPEEADRLEREGYMGGAGEQRGGEGSGGDAGGDDAGAGPSSRRVTVEDVEGDEGGE